MPENSPPLGLLSEIPLSPEAVPIFEEICRQRSITSQQARDNLEDELKLEVMYAGMIVVCDRKPGGDIDIIAAGYPGDESVRSAIAQLDEPSASSSLEAFSVLPLEL